MRDEAARGFVMEATNTYLHTSSIAPASGCCTARTAQFDVAFDEYQVALNLMDRNTALNYVAEAHWGMSLVAFERAHLAECLHGREEQLYQVYNPTQIDHQRWRIGGLSRSWSLVPTKENIRLRLLKGPGMDLYFWLTLCTVLIAAPGTVVSILELIEWRQKHKKGKSKPT